MTSAHIDGHASVTGDSYRSPALFLHDATSRAPGRHRAPGRRSPRGAPRLVPSSSRPALSASRYSFLDLREASSEAPAPARPLLWGVQGHAGKDGERCCESRSTTSRGP